MYHRCWKLCRGDDFRDVVVDLRKVKADREIKSLLLSRRIRREMKFCHDFRYIVSDSGSKLSRLLNTNLQFLDTSFVVLSSVFW